MKRITLLLGLLFVTSITISAQTARTGIFGTYDQKSIIAPDEYRDSEYDVEILPDNKSRKKIWVRNLIPNQEFYAILNVNDEEEVLYAVPRQIVGNYQINIGCIMFSMGDEEYDDPDMLNSIVIVLNNEAMCPGIRQADFQTEIDVSKDGVKVGDIEASSSGSVTTGNGVDIDEEGISVNTKRLMEGIQYVGNRYD